MGLRPAVPGDLDEVLRLCAARPRPGLPARRVSAEQRRHALVEAWRQRWVHLGTDPDLHVLVREGTERLEGYAVLLTGLKESITGEPQAVLHDHAWEGPEVGRELVQAAEELAQAGGADYLVLEIHPDEEGLEDLFAGLGYHVEIRRIARRLEPIPLPEGPYTVRPARRSDGMFVLLLNGQVARYTLPAGRGLDPDVVAQRYLDAYMGLDLVGDPGLQVLVVEAERKQVGYLMLKRGYRDEVTGEALAYIYDLAIHPDHWGRRATQRLMREAEALLHAEGVGLMLGDVSADNARALKTATKSLGFVLEQNRWARRLGARS